MNVSSGGTSTDARINVVVADDHPVVSLGVASILRAEMDINLVGVASTISALIALLGQQPCDVLICDYSFSGDQEPDGLALFRRLRRNHPDITIIVLTAHQDVASFVSRVMNTGVAGFLRKSSQDFARLPAIVRSVHAGRKFIDPSAAAELLSAGPGPQPSIESLSERELEVFRMLGRGMSVTEIAMHTNRSVKTVSNQKMKAMHKLGARSEADLYRIYVEQFE
ncbi:response regulator transcription factor [Burkholderia multivorans]|uniref:response regulator transcription factor n=1 Tax=Burkholderia multivorans TaxID=87883 RepID=UPI001C2544A2|nr:response regulator transcription factor [Burkholderia multivorans]MBU9337249.1 response regulator transcription factor [Burkholderia multivorans]MCA8480116.1 response regulator transcription factor [Burkholderia multivorans]